MAKSDISAIDRRTFAECQGCGPEALGVAREDYVNVTGASSLVHCNTCLHTFCGCQEEPRVCLTCIRQLESGEALWRKDVRVVRGCERSPPPPLLTCRRVLPQFPYSYGRTVPVEEPA